MTNNKCYNVNECGVIKMKTNAIRVSFILLAVVLLLTACAGDGNSSPATTSTATKTPNPTDNTLMASDSYSTPDVSPGYEETIPFIYDRVGPFSEGLAAVSIGGKWGVIDTDGKEIVRMLNYLEISPFSNGVARVRNSNGVGFIDKTGKEIIQIGTLDPYVTSFTDGLAVFKDYTRITRNGMETYEIKYGYIDTAGIVAIPAVYSQCSPFLGGFALVEFGGDAVNKASIIDVFGNEIMTFEDETRIKPLGYFWLTAEATATQNYGANRRKPGPIRSSSNRLIKATDWDGMSGFIDTKGNVVIPFNFNPYRIRPFSDDLAAICASGSDAWGFIDQKGNEAVPCQYVWVDNFSEGMAMVVYHDKVGFIDKTGKEVIPLIYDDDYNVYDGYYTASYFSEGLAIVKFNGKAGYIDRNGNEIVPFGLFELDSNISYLSEGMAAVKKNGKWGFIKISGITNDYKPLTPITENQSTVAINPSVASPPSITDSATPSLASGTFNWQSIYSDKIIDIIEHLGTPAVGRLYEHYQNLSAISIADLNFDGTPEMMVFLNEYGVTVECYTIVNSNAQRFLLESGFQWEFINLVREKSTDRILYLLHASEEIYGPEVSEGVCEGSAYDAYYIFDNITDISIFNTALDKDRLLPHVKFYFQCDMDGIYSYQIDNNSVSKYEYSSAIAAFAAKYTDIEYKIASLDVKPFKNQVDSSFPYTYTYNIEKLMSELFALFKAYTPVW